MSRILIPVLASLILLSHMVPPATAAGDDDDAAEPERIVSKRPPGRSAELRAEWEAYTEARPKDPLGWSQLARAARYAGAPCEEYVPYAENAVRLGADDALARTTLGSFCWKMYCATQEEDPARAIGELETALRLDPSLGEPHFTLWVMKLNAKDRTGAAKHLRAIFNGGHLPDLLVDLAHNMLVAVEPDAIILTNGDNDTYPPLALQAARGFRTDVTIVNISLLNTAWYREEMRDGPSAIPLPAIADDAKGPQGGAAVNGLIDNLARGGWKRPLYVATTVSLGRISIANRLSLEGTVYRVLPEKGGEKETDLARLRENMDERYRLESASSIAFDWEYHSALPYQVMNYIAAYARLARGLAEGGEFEAARKEIREALRLCEFHGKAEFGRSIAEHWVIWDADSEEPESWLSRFDDQETH